MFLLEYLKNPLSVGAIAPSSKYLAYEMINGIDFEKANCIIEYGPGTGVFTEKIVAKATENTTVILIEINKEFYQSLSNFYANKKNVIVMNDSAENVDKILAKYSIEKVDYIISGLPFSSLPRKVSDNILRKTSEIIRNGGEFITFQYTLLKIDYIKSFFKDIKYKKVIRNMPPAYVLRCF